MQSDTIKKLPFKFYLSSKTITFALQFKQIKQFLLVKYMSTKRHIEDKTEKNLEAIEEKLTSSEQFLEKNQRKILIGLGVLIALVGLAFAYQYLYKIPKNRKAEAAIFPGERYFQEGRDSLALFGDGNGFIGLEEVINQYGGTKTANLAHAYAGISYSRLGKNDKALEHLKKFGASDILVAPAINGKIGDVYMDMGKTDEAISYFTKASDKADDVMLSPIYLKKAGVAYLNAKNYDKAIEIFTKIKDKYLNTPEGQEADKYIIAAQLQKGTN